MKNLICLFLFVNFFTINAQYLHNSNLKVYKKDIINYLLEKKEFSGNESIEELLNMIYVRNIYIDRSFISFYEIGSTSPNSLKYLLILKNKKIKIYSNDDFNFKIIAYYFKNSTYNRSISYENVFNILHSISLINDYNKTIENNGKIIIPSQQ